MKIAAIIAAAGLSSRMHEFKPLMTLCDDTIIGTVISTLKQSGINELIVVTGYKSEILTPYLDKFGVRSVINKDYAKTNMFDSIRMGLTSVSNDADKIFITPGDVPLVSIDTICKMIKRDSDIVIPEHNGKTGHPVMLSKNAVMKILQYKGNDGLKCAINCSGYTPEYIKVNDLGILMDADTPEDFSTLRKHAMNMKGRSGLWSKVDITLGIESEIFTPENTQFLEMIDHLGSIQLACSSMHISYSKGWNILNKMESDLNIELVSRQNGGSGGGGTHLTQAGKKYINAYQNYLLDVRKYSEKCFEKYFMEI